jgi:hypothetical protein
MRRDNQESRNSPKRVEWEEATGLRFRCVAAFYVKTAAVPFIEKEARWWAVRRAVGNAFA